MPFFAGDDGLPHLPVGFARGLSRAENARIFSQDFLQRIAGERGELGVDVFDVALGIGDDDRIGALFDDPGQQAKLGFDQVVLGDVAGDFGYTDDAADWVCDGGNSDTNIDELSVFAHADGFQMVDRLAAFDALEYFVLFMNALRREEHQDRLTDGFGGGITESFFRAVIPTCDDSVEGVADDDIIRGVDDGLE